MTSKQYVKKNKIITAQFVEKKHTQKKTRVALLNKIASQRLLCSVSDSRKSTFLKQKFTSKMLKPKTFRQY